ncbi:SDR family oxidoreductase [Alkalihalophilus lindianensis]|uniref:SDR family oxidoreductase n=1 Tax=Alkalihalophilus lindianensis TaxID=1630542 RepID=A0ABU3XER6_9BACI|nr:SDR family oxidoreductase [Alkalihalophilus lindianensis]MDV2686376.1 SDR family oxidoreductase [Alkalihalophilus lindianensis]
MIIEEKKIVLITGTNSGFGLLATLELAKRGYQVVATMRDLSKKDLLIERAKQLNIVQSIDVVKLNVTSEDQINAVKKHIEEQYGRLDVLINNAGYSVGGMTEQLEISQWKEQLDTNVFGVVAITKACLPLLRRTQAAKIINLGSISGRIGFPGLAPYVTSKFALSGFSESLRLELLPFNISVSLIEAGSFKTNIWDKGLAGVQSQRNDEYGPFLRKIYDEAEQTAKSAADPEEVIKLMVKISEAQKPKFRYQVGKGVKKLIFFKSVLPWFVIEWFVKRRLMK